MRDENEDEVLMSKDNIVDMIMRMYHFENSSRERDLKETLHKFDRDTLVNMIRCTTNKSIRVESELEEAIRRAK